ncbi:hypothetical protein HWV62_3721 [Athelia sp. TMB]|nr:hypothetical protein HWV62_3721 [Athelia sp. TMB]
MPSSQVKKFNRLPRNEMAPSGKVSNTWHFDVRYISLAPPSHVLFLVQLDSEYVHMEQLPLKIGPSSPSSFDYFPESAEDAAPEVVKALLHSFLTSFGLGKFQNPPPPAYAPWKLTTDDKALAAAVGEELRFIGIKPELCTIGITRQNNKQVDRAFGGLFKQMLKSMSVTGVVAEALVAPESIGFANNARSRYWPPIKEDEEEMDRVLQYVQKLQSATFTNQEVSKLTARSMQHFQACMQELPRRSADSVRAAADAGDIDSAIQYALRIQFGIDVVKRDRQLSRSYLVKVITSPLATAKSKSIAHALLLEWYIYTEGDGSIRARYLHAAAYHADQSAALTQPLGGSAPAVLYFGREVLDPMSHKVPELLLQYKSLWAALKFREAEMAADNAKGQERRRKQPSRYRCANVGCQIMADTGKMFKQYWKNHKPFCKPNMPSSVIDDGSVDDFLGGSTEAGTMGIPITKPDGSKMVFSSSTMDAEMLKEFKVHIENLEISGSSAQGLGRSVTVEVNRLE